MEFFKIFFGSKGKIPVSLNDLIIIFFEKAFFSELINNLINNSVLFGFLEKWRKKKSVKLHLIFFFNSAKHYLKAE